MVARKRSRSFQNPRNLQMFSSVNDSQYTVLKIKHLNTTNRDYKKANKQNLRYYSINSNGQDNI